MLHRPFIRTLRAQWLGQRLLVLRDQRGFTLRLVAEHLGRDQLRLVPVASAYDRILQFALSSRESRELVATIIDGL